VASGAESIDLKGNFLMPGLIDSHCHAIEGGLSLLAADIGENVKSVDELVAFADEAKKSGRGMKGDIVSVSGIRWPFGRRTRNSTNGSTRVLTRISRSFWKGWMATRLGRIRRC